MPLDLGAPKAVPQWGQTAAVWTTGLEQLGQNRWPGMIGLPEGVVADAAGVSPWFELTVRSSCGSLISLNFILRVTLRGDSTGSPDAYTASRVNKWRLVYHLVTARR